MKINTSQISMDASAEHRDVTGRSIQMGTSRQEGEPEFRLNLPGVSGFQRERSEENRQSQECNATSSIRGPDGTLDCKTTTSEHVMERMVTEVVGQRVRIRQIQGLGNQNSVVLTESLNPPSQRATFSVTSVFSSYQYEKVSVQSSGSVQLEDGRNITFSLDLSMERESLVRESMTWGATGGVLLDPLVFSFDCNLESLANRDFLFDLDCDGVCEESFSLQPGSGFLALDLNNDQRVNDGSELFGPTTGHGFQELALHDTDGNGWIDENDPVFAKLLIWKPNESGDGSMLSLAEAGVGAICLTHDQTSFKLRDSNNTLMGEVAASGFFLTEDGEVRPLQEIKLATKGMSNVEAELATTDESTEAQIFLRQMIALREAEVHELAKRRHLRSRENEQNLLETLFPDWQKERGLESVVSRRERSNLV